MPEPKLHWYEEKELNNPIAIVGFPSVGLAGSILTSFLARELKLPVVGGIILPDVVPYTFLQGGNAYPPIRIHAGPVPKAKRKKKAPAPAEGEITEAPAEEEVKPAPRKREKSRDVVILTSEIAPKPEQSYEFTLFIIDTLKSMGVTDIIFVDGIPRTEPTAQVIAAYSNEEVKAKLEERDITLMNDGLIRGISGIGLFQCKIDGVNAMCIITPAHPQIPDPRAAADLLGPLEKLIPRLKVDPSPLFLEAEEIENKIRAQQTQQSMINQNLYG